MAAGGGVCAWLALGSADGSQWPRAAGAGTLRLADGAVAALAALGCAPGSGICALDSGRAAGAQLLC